MLKVIHTAITLPISIPMDPTAEFEPGMIGQLKIIGNDIVCGVSDGTAPFGIIDDARTNAFKKSQIDEVIEIDISATETDENGNLVNISEAIGFLEFSNIVNGSFTSTISVILNAVNGAVIVPAGTPLNFDFDGDGVYDGFRIIASYVYEVPNKPGDDTTLGSGRITIHYARGFYATDQFDTLQPYPLNATLYVGLEGKFTTRQPTSSHPGIAMVTGPPGATNGTLELLWF